MPRPLGLLLQGQAHHPFKDREPAALPAPSGRFPSRPLQPRRPAKVSLLTFCPTVPARLPRSVSPLVDLSRPHPIPPPATARKISQLPWSQESPLPSFTDGETGLERDRVLYTAKSRQSQDKIPSLWPLAWPPSTQQALCPPFHAPPQSSPEDPNPLLLEALPWDTPLPLAIASLSRFGRWRFLSAGLSFLPEPRSSEQDPAPPLSLL